MSDTELLITLELWRLRGPDTLRTGKKAAQDNERTKVVEPLNNLLDLHLGDFALSERAAV